MEFKTLASKCVGLLVMFILISAPAAHAQTDTPNDGLETGSSTLGITASSSGSDSVFMPRPRPHSSGFLEYDDQFAPHLFSGSASYSYEIETPTGINGFEPSIQLFYNHHAARSLGSAVGTGWSISGGTIARDIKETWGDTSDDVFRISMQGVNDELVFVSEENRYHTLHETNFFVQKVSGGNNEKGEYWIVRTPDGTEHRFGYNTYSEQVSNTHGYVTKWSLDKVEDVHGKEIIYEYREDPNSDVGTVLPSKIEYNNNRISFVHEHVPSIQVSFIAGNRVIRTTRIKEIVVEQGNNFVRKYLLSYETIEGRHFLESLTEIGTDGVSSLQPTTFWYNQFNPLFVNLDQWQLPSGAYFGSNLDEGVRLADINSDGLVDVVKAKGSSHSVSYNNGQGFDSFVDLPNFIPSGFVDTNYNDRGVRFADLNGDTRIDVVQSISGGSNQKSAKLNTGTGFEDHSLVLPDGLSFVWLDESVTCSPNSCDPAYDDLGVSCDRSVCTRTCSYTYYMCQNNWQQVFHDQGSGYDSGDAEEFDDTNRYSAPSNNKCYKYFVDTPDRINMRVDDNDCNGDDDGDSIFIAGLQGDGSSQSWLRTIPNMDGIRQWYGDHPRADFENSYVTSYESSGDDFDSDDKEDFEEQEDATVYCTPNYDSCLVSNLDSVCGFGCLNEGTEAYVQSGYYVDVGSRMETIANDDECDDSEVSTNRAEYIALTVYESDATPQNYQYGEQCAKPSSIKDLGVRLVDLNGDGMTDIIEGRHPTTRAWLNTGSGYIEANNWAIPFDNHFVNEEGVDWGIRFGDINGDGLIDMVKNSESDRKVWLNAGVGWEYRESWITPPEMAFVNNGENLGVQLVDINLDGKADLVKGKNGYTDVWINNGNGWAPASWEIPSEIAFDDFSHQIVDINGDGTLDIVKASPQERKTWIGAYSNSYLLTKVVNSLAGTTEIGYKNIPSLDNTGGDGISDLSFSGAVVAWLKHNDGITNRNVLNYDYSDGMYDPSSREFRGFAKVVVKDSSGSTSEHFFFQDDAKKGLEHKTRILDAGGKLVSEAINEFSEQFSDNYYTVLPKSRTEKRFDGNDVPFETRISYSSDSYGNPTVISLEGDTSISSDNKRTEIEYAYNTQSWIVNRETRIALRNSNGEKVSETLLTYDNLGFGQSPVRGLVTQEVLWNSEGENPVYSYTYDSFGNLLSETDPNGHTTAYSYDSTKVFPSSITNNLGHVHSFSYNPATGNLKSETDPNGFTTSYFYDVFGRQIKEVQTYDSESSPTTEIEYDFDGIVVERLSVKQKESDGSVYETMYFYDGFGRLIQIKSAAADGEQIVTDVEYDANSRISSESNPYFAEFSKNYRTPDLSIPRVSYSYDALNRVIFATNPDGSFKELTFDRSSASVFDENSNQIDYLNDAFGNIVEVTEHDNAELYKTAYTYDAADNLVSITDNEGNRISYVYDSLGSRVRVDDPNIGTWTYEYDLAGNLIRQVDSKENGASSTGSSGTNINDNTISFSREYDANGNVLSNNNNLFEYDGFNQLRKIKSKEDELLAEYFYDQDGERIKKVTYDSESSTTTYYLGDLIRVVNSNGTYDTVHYNANGKLVGRKDSEGALFFYHPDNLGSTNLVTGEAKNVVERTEYMPFGQVVSGNDRFMFTGQENDPESKLMYFGSRYYNPFLRQFTQPDSLLPNAYDPQQLNRYAYVRNNPYKYTDPTGNFLDIVADIGFITWDIYDIVRDPRDWRNHAALFADVGAAFVPFVTGVGRGIKLASKADSLFDTGNSVSKISKIRKTSKSNSGFDSVKKMFDSKKGSLGGGFKRRVDNVEIGEHQFKRHVRGRLSESQLQRATTGKSADSLFSNRVDSAEIVSEAFKTGNSIGRNRVVMKFDQIIGYSKGEPTQYVEVVIDNIAKREVHGFPITKKRYLDKKRSRRE
jgi:RHS repeat-associated protein